MIGAPGSIIVMSFVIRHINPSGIGVMGSMRHIMMSVYIFMIAGYRPGSPVHVIGRVIIPVIG